MLNEQAGYNYRMRSRMRIPQPGLASLAQQGAYRSQAVAPNVIAQGMRRQQAGYINSQPNLMPPGQPPMTPVAPAPRMLPYQQLSLAPQASQPQLQGIYSARKRMVPPPRMPLPAVAMLANMIQGGLL